MLDYKSEVILEKKICSVKSLLEFLQLIDNNEDVYVKIDAILRNDVMISKARLVEYTLTDGSKVRDLVFS